MKTIFDFIRKPYYYVPPCPRCGSPVTGRYVTMWMCKKWIIEDSLYHGEYVRQADGDDLRDKAFCLDCNYIWPEEARLKWMTLNEIKKQKAIRHTCETFESIYAKRKVKKEKTWFSKWFNLF